MYVGDLVERIVNAVDDRDSLFAGATRSAAPRCLRLRQILELIIDTATLPVRIMPLGKGLSQMQALVLQNLPGKLFTMDNYRSLQTDNVCADGEPPDQPAPVPARPAGHVRQQTRTTIGIRRELPRQRVRGFVKKYRVGGCVRDRLLGLAVNDIDWVVTGATSREMLAAGYKSIGKDFPVFLHPESKQEYALARSERKTGPGYRGFEVSADPSTTIEQDLLRRDLTINAMAEDEDGNLVDPYGGRRDGSKPACLRKLASPPLSSKTVRVLRVGPVRRPLGTGWDSAWPRIRAT